MDMNSIISLLAGIFGGGFSIKLVDYLLNRRKANAEAKEKEVDSDIKLVDSAVGYAQMLKKDLEDMKARMDLIEEENERLEKTNNELRLEVEKLRTEVEELKKENEALHILIGKSHNQ